jgi:hypothetical protein
MPTQVAWVVISDLLPIFLGGFEPPFVNELGKILGGMDHLKVHLELGIFILEGVVAVRRRNENFLHSVFDKRLDVLPSQAFE